MTTILRTGLVLAIIGFLGVPGVDDRALSASPDAVSSGKAVYTSLCARCHGVDGKGEGYTRFIPPVADLTGPAAQSKLDATLFKEIHDGKANTAMGSWKMALTDQQIIDVLAYVRLLGGYRESDQP